VQVSSHVTPHLLTVQVSSHVTPHLLTVQVSSHMTPQLGARIVSHVEGFLQGWSCHICGKNRVVLRSFVIEFSYCNSVRMCVQSTSPREVTAFDIFLRKLKGRGGFLDYKEIPGTCRKTFKANLKENYKKRDQKCSLCTNLLKK
jgi:hypothetical protein